MLNRVRSKNSTSNFSALAEQKTRYTLTRIQRFPALRRLGPRQAKWQAGVKLLGTSKAMAKLNLKYRGKNRATDVLSFPAHPVFWEIGYLGELAICLPVLRKQAKELGHTAEAELEVLITHGLLHLLGLDHEKSVRQAGVMARWEARLLNKRSGLIARARSGNH